MAARRAVTYLGPTLVAPEVGSRSLPGDQCGVVPPTDGSNVHELNNNEGDPDWALLLTFGRAARPSAVALYLLGPERAKRS